MGQFGQGITRSVIERIYCFRHTVRVKDALLSLSGLYKLLAAINLFHLEEGRKLYFLNALNIHSLWCKAIRMSVREANDNNIFLVTVSVKNAEMSS